MKYILKNIVSHDNIIDTVLNNIGVNNLEKLLKPDSSNDTNPLSVPNMEKGLELLLKVIKENGKILILVDSDCDGLTSGAYMWRYLTTAFSDIWVDYYTHSEKKHGLTKEFMEFLKDKHYDLIIVPDAGTNDIENIEFIENVYDTRVLIIDHHEIEVVSEYGVIINNQVKLDNVNRNLTGVGMVYLFCKQLDKLIGKNLSSMFKDLVMIGQIGDLSNLSENEVRNICLNSLSHISNPFIETFYNENRKDKLNNLTFTDLSFGGIIPLINAVTRTGTIEERALIFEALAGIGADETFLVTKRKLNKETRKYEYIDFVMNKYQYAIEVGNKCKSEQQKLAKKFIDILSPQYNEESDIQIYIIPDKSEIKGLTGLMANKMVDKFSKPSIVCWRDNGLLRGSLRGYERILGDFKAWCISTNLFDLVQGHANAAGIELREDRLDEFIKISKKVESTGKIHYVDNIYNGFVPMLDIEIISKYEVLWKNGIEKPKFALESIDIPKSNIKWSKNTLRIKKDNITFIKFKTTEEEYKELINSDLDIVRMSFVGSFEKNVWNGMIFYQVMVEEYEKFDYIPTVYDFSIFS